jgi:hypothetical protein
MAIVQRHAWAFVIASLLVGCSEWSPLRSARDVEGQRVRVQAAGKEEVVIEEVVTCDDKGFIIASQVSDCRENPERTFDTRRDKVSVHDKDTKSSIGIAVACILACIFVPAGIVGTAIISSR